MMPPASLGEIVQQRVSRLSFAAREFLEMLAAVGEPLPESLAIHLARAGPEIPTPAPSSVVSTLLSQNFVRRRESSGEPEIEICHDQIRAAVIATVPEPMRKRCICGSLRHWRQLSIRMPEWSQYISRKAATSGEQRNTPCVRPKQQRTCWRLIALHSSGGWPWRSRRTTALKRHGSISIWRARMQRADAGLNPLVHTRKRRNSQMAANAARVTPSRGRGVDTVRQPEAGDCAAGDDRKRVSDTVYGQCRGRRSFDPVVARGAGCGGCGIESGRPGSFRRRIWHASISIGR